MNENFIINTALKFESAVMRIDRNCMAMGNDIRKQKIAINKIGNRTGLGLLLCAYLFYRKDKQIDALNARLKKLEKELSCTVENDEDK